MDPILQVKDLRTHFHLDRHVVRAVDGLSYDLFPGRTLAVVGESGSGKTVHALSILRLVPQPPGKYAGGQILFKGQDLLRMPEDELRKVRGNKVAMIFQEPMTSLNPVLPIGEQIAEAHRLHCGSSEEKARHRAAYLLERVGIPHAKSRLDEYPHQFSGGMRQRVMIAMALACDPEILIADEPTTALDVTVQAQILELIKELQREFRMAVILITHNLGIVAEIADDVIVMYAGRAIEQAKIRDLFRSPKHPYTQGLLASIPSLFGRVDRLTAIPGQPPDLSHPFHACPFAPRCAKVMDVCKEKDPPNFYPAADHMANCWLHDDKTKAHARERTAA